MEPQNGEQDILFRPFDKAETPNQTTGRRAGAKLRLPRPVLGCLVVVIALFLVIGAVSFTADRICYSNLTRLLPIYPDAQITMRSHNLVNEFGMGVTTMVLTTPDDPEIVRNWYGRQTSAYRIETRENKTPFASLARGQVDVSHNSDGEGSQIILYGTCVN